jgi:hypothetical protein
MLPSELSWALNMIGIPWPNIDEDQLHQSASQLRQVTAELGNTHQQASVSIQGTLVANQSIALQGFEKVWGMLEEHLPTVIDVLNGLAEFLDVAADVVTGMKTGIIAALVAFAAEFLADQALAVETLGASEAAIPAEIAVTDEIVDQILNQVAQQLEEQAEQIVQKAVSDVAQKVIADLAKQLEGMLTGKQSSFDWSQLGDSVLQGAQKAGSDTWSTATGIVQNAVQSTLHPSGDADEGEDGGEAGAGAGGGGGASAGGTGEGGGGGGAAASVRVHASVGVGGGAEEE